MLQPGKGVVEAVSHIELAMKSSIMFYQEKQSQFLKIYVTLPKFVSQLRGHFEKDSVIFRNKQAVFSEVTYESNVPFGLRFMIDTDMRGMSWVKIKPSSYKVRNLYSAERISTC